jgi:Zn-dependent protease
MMQDWRATVPRASAFRPSPVFLGLVALFVAGGALAWFEAGPPAFAIIVFVMAGWLVSLSLHEYGHALVAYLRGDRSVAERGYLTLNVLKYTHPFLSVVLPLLFLLLGGIGLPGGAVWIDRHAVRTRLGQTMISLVGPLVNAVFAIALSLPFVLGVDIGAHLLFWGGVAFLAFLQVTATILNLTPIPGVDGGNAVRPWLTPQWQRGFDYVAPYGLILLFVLLFQSGGNFFFFQVVDTVCGAIGLPTGMAAFGQSTFQFWRS